MFTKHIRLEKYEYFYKTNHEELIEHKCENWENKTQHITIGN